MHFADPGSSLDRVVANPSKCCKRPQNRVVLGVVGKWSEEIGDARNALLDAKPGVKVISQKLALSMPLTLNDLPVLRMGTRSAHAADHHTVLIPRSSKSIT